MKSLIVFIKSPLFRHLIFWIFFSLFFLTKTSSINSRDFIPGMLYLISFAIAVYINLYVLFDKFYFKKKYLAYFSFLIVLILFCSFFLYALIPKSGTRFVTGFSQHILNFFFIILISSSLKFYQEMKRRQMNIIELEKKQLQTELSLLRSQINPHFLFNTLNNLLGLISSDQTENAAHIVIRLSDLMRYLLETSKLEVVNLWSEIQFIEDYITLEKIRFPSSKDVSFEVSGVKDDIMIPPMLFIPLVENAFKHGLEHETNSGYAHFSLSVQGKLLFFEAINSKHSNLLLFSTKIGLKNLQSRLKLLYPSHFELLIDEGTDLYKITLIIQLEP